MYSLPHNGTVVEVHHKSLCIVAKVQQRTGVVGKFTLLIALTLTLSENELSVPYTNMHSPPKAYVRPAPRGYQRLNLLLNLS